MKKKISKQEAQNQINKFFQKSSFTPEQVKKIKRLAMKYNIKLGPHKKKFCKKCLSQLKGKTRISRIYKTIECQECKYKNKWRL